MNRSLEEVEWRAGLGLARFPVDVRQKLVAVARSKSPSAAAREGQLFVSIAGFGDSYNLLAAQKGTRWLAVIRRDHGQEKFEQVAANLLQLPYAEQR